MTIRCLESVADESRVTGYPEVVNHMDEGWASGRAISAIDLFDFSTSAKSPKADYSSTLKILILISFSSVRSFRPRARILSTNGRST